MSTPSPLPPLAPPLLIATDGSVSAHIAQKFLYPVARLLKSQHLTQEDALIRVLTVQPRAGRRGKSTPSLPEPSEGSESEESSTVAADSDFQATWQESNGSHPHPSVEPLLSIEAEFPADIPVSFQVRQGRPATEILHHARQIQAGLVAVGHRGTGGVRELLLGSVSSAIARYADCNVLVARGAWEDKTATVSWGHVLLVLNGSNATQQAIATTRQLVPAGIQKVTILCVQTPLTTHYLFGPFANPTPSWQLNQLLQQVQKEQSEQLLQQAREALNLPGLDIQTLVQTSEPGPLICQIAQQQQVDVIILGSDRRPAFRNIRLSATGDYTIHHAPCPVMLCRVARSDLQPHPVSQPE